MLIQLFVFTSFDMAKVPGMYAVELTAVGNRGNPLRRISIWDNR